MPPDTVLRLLRVEGPLSRSPFGFRAQGKKARVDSLKSKVWSLGSGVWFRVLGLGFLV